MSAIAILTSGGDAPGMNAALRTIVKLAAAEGVTAYGVEQGYEGLMAGRLRELTRSMGEGLAPLLAVDSAAHAGGTLLGSARSAAFRTAAGRQRAAGQLASLGVERLIVIGGNGSLTGAHALAAESDLKVIGVPASIDNDIGCTSTAIGVDTALNTIVEACDRISDTARAHHRAFVVEVMGRDSGYLAMASAVAAGADAVLFRERGHTEDEVVRAVEATIRRSFDAQRGKRRVLIIKAEGVEVPCTRLVRLLQQRLGDLPHAEIRATVLGHVVRGGNPSFQDRMVAGRLALAAVEAALSGASDEMVAWQPNVAGGIQTADPHVQRFPLETVLSETAALLDGSSPVTRRRIAMMEKIEGVLAL
jgi:6-phosphofructokinase 1